MTRTFFGRSYLSKLKHSQVILSNGEKQAARRRKAVPYQFVLDAIAEAGPTTRTMFGSLAVYVGEKIVFILRDRLNDQPANGIWIAIPAEHQNSLRSHFPHAGLVRIMGKDISGWQLLSANAPDFEESVLHACDLVMKKDHRIGKVPNRKRTADS